MTPMSTTFGLTLSLDGDTKNVGGELVVPPFAMPFPFESVSAAHTGHTRGALGGAGT